MDATEFDVLHEALAQYVQNTEDMEGENPKVDAKLAVARNLLNVFDAARASAPK